MQWIRIIFKAELELIKEKKTSLLMLFFSILTIGMLAFSAMRVVIPSQRNVLSIVKTLWQATWPQKLHMVRACAELNFSGVHVRQGDKKIGRIYLEYDSELKFLLVVMVSTDQEHRVVMSIVDSGGVLSKIGVFKGLWLMIY